MLSPEQKDLVKATVPVLKENGVALTDYFYKRMLGNNPQLKETFNMGHQRSGAQAKALAGAVLAYAENIDDPSVLAPVVELICHKHVSLNIQAPDYDIVGENLLHSISEVLNISMEDDLIAAWGAAYKQLADLFIATEKAIYDEHEKTKGSWLGWRNFVVSRKVKENDEITSFYLIPQNKQSLPQYKPGQYITVRVTVPELGIKQPRQYSLSDSPSGEYLRISVKREDAHVENQDPGYVSSTLHNHINEGDVIEVSAPTGNFFLINPEKNNVLISAGIGLTPMIAMLNQLITENTDPNQKASFWDKIKAPFTHHNAHKNQISFIHAARNPEVHAMRKEVKALSQHHDHLNVFVAYEQIADNSKISREDYQQLGRLDLTKVPVNLLPKDADYYLCGPIPFMQHQNQTLLALGIPQDQIHSEAFGTGGVAL
ncbi:nitric oxide dioxygenase [Acinetobacter qingfengensis]|uniref:Flavohemoprotein n=1 Tax=Acinetobacter qingfengensis TaxID=1262585 RepID=A0A1E7R3E6_9GAMM|nr:globin domain-containing protein [Acinetobacter qingfengensis]KAA8735582.1 nitric oxide dioxygenase [Acinetobacter qingfengensis]OEY93878.1 nitric oxide dioxygenase [Acinetobacter qingfengensis]